MKKTKSKKDMRSIRQDLIQIPCVSDPSIYAIGAQFAYGIGGRLRSPIGVRYWTSRHWPSSPFWWHLGDFHTHWVQASIRSPRLTWSRGEIDHHICDVSNDKMFGFTSPSPSPSWKRMRQTKRASGWSQRRGRAVQVPLSNALGWWKWWWWWKRWPSSHLQAIGGIAPQEGEAVIVSVLPISATLHLIHSCSSWCNIWWQNQVVREAVHNYHN